jgi:ribosomal protein L37AE/L43A
MAVGNLQITRARCPVCAKDTKMERPAQVWGMGDLIMVVMTLGLWIIAKRASRPAWRCSDCGSKATGQI